MHIPVHCRYLHSRIHGHLSLRTNVGMNNSQQRGRLKTWESYLHGVHGYHGPSLLERHTGNHVVAHQTRVRCGHVLVLQGARWVVGCMLQINRACHHSCTKHTVIAAFHLLYELLYRQFDRPAASCQATHNSNHTFFQNVLRAA